jgi:predicted kinase
VADVGARRRFVTERIAHACAAAVLRDNRTVRRVVLVSGAPGSGKTTIAVPLAAELGFPLLSKDIIKEQLFDVLGAGDGDSVSWSKRLGAASMELMWTLAGQFPEAVLEAGFRPHSACERSRISQLSDCIIEVNCVCPFEVASNPILCSRSERSPPRSRPT